MTHCPSPLVDAIDQLDQLAERVVTLLELHGAQLVLAESCTAGLIAGTMGGIPGVSTVLCGSAVVYQEETKRAWLAVPEEVLARWGTVAETTSLSLAENVLAKTSRATLSLGITGHLGPNTPPELDGAVFVAIAFRKRPPILADCRILHRETSSRQERATRQRLAVVFAFQCLAVAMENMGQI